MLAISDDQIKELCEEKDFEYIGRISRTTKSGRKNLKVQFICNKHRNKGVQEKTIDNLRKKGCIYCAGTNKKTTAEFIKEVMDINPNIEILGQYKSAKTKIECRCKIDETIWDTWPEVLLKGGQCPECNKKAIGNRSRKSPTDFTYEMSLNAPTIKALTKYNTGKDTVCFKCNVCGHERATASPLNISSGHSGCPACGLRRQVAARTKTDEQFRQDLLKTNPNLEPLEQYTTNKQKILVRCKIHSYEWKAIPAQLIYRKTGCPKCSITYNENRVTEILRNWGYSFEMQKRFADCKDKVQLPFDVYLPDFNICIEYDGEQHYQKEKFEWRDSSHSSFELTQKHDLIKTKYCLDNKIPLIRIPYWEADDMESFLFDEMVRYGAIELKQ